MNDRCPCGATARVDRPDREGWIGHCDAGHPLFFENLETHPMIAALAEHRALQRLRASHRKEFDTYYAEEVS